MNFIIEGLKIVAALIGWAIAFFFVLLLTGGSMWIAQALGAGDILSGFIGLVAIVVFGVTILGEDGILSNLK